MRQTSFILAVAVGLTGAAAFAQDNVTPCKDHSGWTKEHRACEVRNYTLAAPEELHVNAGMNGGVAVKGEQRQDVKVEAEVSAWGHTDEEARELLSRVKVIAAGDSLRSEGPDERNPRWAVSFRVTAPSHTSVDLHANNGGLEVSGLEAKSRFATTNGGISVSECSGDVKGETVNGGISAELSGSQWNGSGLNLTTTNGGVHLAIPSGYRAHLDASTVNGGLRINVPIQVSGKIQNSISTDLNGGGAPIHLETVNGGVSVTER